MGGKTSKPEYPKLNHWSTYKIDGIKGLEEYQRILSEQGLKDPWIRNEVWRFRKSLKTTPSGYLRLIAYAAVSAQILLLIRNRVLPRDSHNEPYLF